jgi:hypothetical protein
MGSRIIGTGRPDGCAESRGVSPLATMQTNRSLPFGRFSIFSSPFSLHTSLEINLVPKRPSRCNYQTAIEMVENLINYELFLLITAEMLKTEEKLQNTRIITKSVS